LKLNEDKGGLLLPPGAPDPSPETRACFPPGFVFRRDGFRIAGAPIGTNNFMSEFVANRVTEAIDKVKAIQAVSKQSARAAHRLLTTCASKLLNFIATTVPPLISIPHLTAFDNFVQHTFFSIIRFEPSQCST